jgi:uncharacterized protein (TIGR03083 family)
MAPMRLPAEPGLDELGDGIGAAATVLRANAGAAGLDAPVPTCPGWTVRDLVAHVGVVHRYATRVVSGGRPDVTEAPAAADDDLLGWFDDGATALLQALADAPDDLDAPVFLENAPAPRRYWVRRQCHETSVHAVDALAARLGRAPRPEETWLRPALALDGVDELLRGFVPRPTSTTVQVPRPTTVLVRPIAAAPSRDDQTGRMPVRWVVRARQDAPTDVEVQTADDAAWCEDVVADHVLEAPAVELYLRLWGRATPVGADAADGPDGAARWWTEHVEVRP